MIKLITNNKEYEYRKLSEALKYHVVRALGTNKPLSKGTVNTYVSKAETVNGWKVCFFENCTIKKKIKVK